jgi:hypothetical protein
MLTENQTTLNIQTLMNHFIVWIVDSFADSPLLTFSQFFIVLNLAVGGTGYFPDEATNANGKPWLNTSPTVSRHTHQEIFVPTASCLSAFHAHLLCPILLLVLSFWACANPISILHLRTVLN